MKVKILSGNLAGTVQDLPEVEAEWAVASGFAEKVPEPSEPGLAGSVPEVPASEPETLTPDTGDDQSRRRRGRAAG